MSSKPCLIVISGASGSGKTSLCSLVEERLGFYYAISYTTRSRRPSEQNGIDYYFISRDEFFKMKQEGMFLEWAEVYDNYYGTSKEPLLTYLQQGQNVIVDVDTQGALELKELYPDAVLVFIQAPSLNVLKDRLTKRDSDTKKEQQKRLEEALKEENYKSDYDHIITNRTLDQTYHELETIIQEQCKK